MHKRLLVRRHNNGQGNFANGKVVRIPRRCLRHDLVWNQQYAKDQLLFSRKLSGLANGKGKAIQQSLNPQINHALRETNL